MYLKIGDKAPDFNVLNQDSEIRKLSDLKNKKILIWIFPKANTPG